MQTTLAPRGDAGTFLTHFIGGGLDDECYVIQRYAPAPTARSFLPMPENPAARASAGQGVLSCR